MVVKLYDYTLSEYLTAKGISVNYWEIPRWYEEADPFHFPVYQVGEFKVLACEKILKYLNLDFLFLYEIEYLGGRKGWEIKK